ncbi:MAG: FKBP-type peptidyl-prolyl cis-trans isomerase [Cyclobacteriaceae bacterium]|nr:FKBP-type peptidyl-prolyl cis-trans isomerase [Cyclobacteriaceae bacterium]
MKKLLTLFSFGVLLTFFSCFKQEDIPTFEEQLERDLAAIDAYLAQNSITALQDPNNLIRYVIHEEGDGSSPGLSNCVTTSYKGKLFNGNVFDQNSNISFPLNGVIAGWQVGMQQLNKGDSATLYIPSGLGYGRQGIGSIPGNANLIFNVRLKNIGTVYNNSTGSCN